MPADKKLEEAVSERLRAVMEAFSLQSYAEVAEICGTTKSVVNNWANGYNLPRVPEMIRLCERTGVTMDWLYRGVVVLMDTKLATALEGIIRRNRR